MTKSQEKINNFVHDSESLESLASGYATLKEEIRHVVVGQHDIIEQLLMALFCQGHTLIVGVPGLAKTLLVRTLAQALHLDFSRIQFTPDMMPSDIIGTEFLQSDPITGDRHLRFSKGPVFANIVLADEINRTPPKTQAALLEAMAEKQISVAGETHQLDLPFIVVATQNPIEQEGTYPLPEAQLDRFMFSLQMDYPSRAEERLIAIDPDRGLDAPVKPVFGHVHLTQFRSIIKSMPVSDHILDYIVDLVRATRPNIDNTPADVNAYVAWGAGPRAGQYLILASKCQAAFEGRPTPAIDDVKRIALPVLRHRIVMNYLATGEGISSSDLVSRLLQIVPEPNYD